MSEVIVKKVECVPSFMQPQRYEIITTKTITDINNEVLKNEKGEPGQVIESVVLVTLEKQTQCVADLEVKLAKAKELLAMIKAAEAPEKEAAGE